MENDGGGREEAKGMVRIVNGKYQTIASNSTRDCNKPNTITITIATLMRDKNGSIKIVSLPSPN